MTINEIIFIASGSIIMPDNDNKSNKHKHLAHALINITHFNFVGYDTKVLLKYVSISYYIGNFLKHSIKIILYFKYSFTKIVYRMCNVNFIVLINNTNKIKI